VSGLPAADTTRLKVWLNPGLPGGPLWFFQVTRYLLSVGL
jgi:hypothetical protein